jgi:hypothetical protein
MILTQIVFVFYENLSAKAFKNCVYISRLCRASISKRECLWGFPVNERQGLRLASRKGLKRKARTTTAGRRRTCSGKPDHRDERGLRPNVFIVNY